jgi:two-component system CheB/CheR fusion protein
VRVAIEYCAMQRRLHEQRISLEIFTRALAHDLKEPVRTISSFLGLLTAKERLSETGVAYFEHIRNAAERMAMLIDTVYLYTRLDGSTQEAARELCDAGAVLDDVRANIAKLVKERRATITNAALPQVRANRMQLLQVLQNLACNAIHHGPPAPVVRVSATEQTDRFVFQVTDNGPGVPEAQREKIFEPFKRMARDRERGLGMGLAICRRVVESHGGKIWCEPAPTGGTTFVFTLSKQKQEAAAGAEVKSGKSRRTAAASIEGNPLANVLLVDDSEADVELTRIMLLKEACLKCNLLVARDAEQALTIVNRPTRRSTRGVVDLMLLDINMPGMDGLELLRQLRADEANADLPIIMCTTSSYDQDMERAKKLGATGYVTKPTDLAKIKPTLANIAHLQLRPEDIGYSLMRAT